MNEIDGQVRAQITIVFYLSFGFKPRCSYFSWTKYQLLFFLQSESICCQCHHYLNTCDWRSTYILIGTKDQTSRIEDPTGLQTDQIMNLLNELYPTLSCHIMLCCIRSPFLHYLVMSSMHISYIINPVKNLFYNVCHNTQSNITTAEWITFNIDTNIQEHYLKTPKS